MRKYIYFTVFASGMTTLAAELSASRLIGNVFGSSNLVWASIIGLILIYLTIGYFLGGRWADRWPNAASMYRVLAWGAFALGVVPYLANPVLRFAARSFEGLDVAVLLGSFAAVLILFSMPVTLLGTISPFAIRLSVDDPRTAGAVSGTIYGISTLGSFIGTFLPVLVTIPIIGTRNTFLLFSLLLLFVALAGLGKYGSRRLLLQHSWMPVALAALALISAGQSLKRSTGQIYEAESAYNYIQVQQINGFTLLRLNDGEGVHSEYSPDTLNYGGPWEQFLVGPYFYRGMTPDRIKRMAIVGLAAGTTARQATAVYGPIQIDGYELDPEIVEVGRRYFAEDLPNLNVHIGDGRWNLEQSPYKYDIIAVDAYRPPYIPPHMTTQEFYQICSDHLTDTGVVAINVGSVPGDRRLINGLATTMATVFPSVHIMDIPGTLNTMIFATRQPTQTGDFAANLSLLSQQPGVHPLLLTAMQTTFANLKPGYERTQVFTDDRAPIEWIVNDMVVRFALSGQLQGLGQ
ncbi:MAG TPA: fused MFS/spermidine synthase [Anaerolineales bacterium]|nr:fused MFS/spermidine synthase [Anaerolineales bacterium]